ncbi:LuxR C-terminal-related transcriptional regulator [Streptomyces sp. NPDC050085]|uniref:LuxR C-terminal-related transcriptional regulator n=1 Tax=Streptomyces sp. NPDC050085 TaxID=3365600 RepID=UPI0037A2B63A
MEDTQKDSHRGRVPRVPFGVTSFVGRRQELGHLVDAMARSRLVTVTGPGGIGKSRLAAEAAGRAAGRFADGLCVADLSGLTDADLLPHTVAAALDLHDSDARPSVDGVIAHLGGRNMLLVLDTCERVVDGCAAFVARLLAEAPEVHVLATSRQSLAVQGEHLYAVPSLSEADARELFTQRAADVVTDFLVDRPQQAQLTSLCRRLDGMPLALELAAVRLKALTLAALDRQLHHHFRLLDAKRMGVVPRQQTLRASLDWSHALCTPLERDLWARLSVFAGPFDLDAALAVCAQGELTEDQVLEALFGLVDKSIVQYTDRHEGGWYRLLDTLREFGAELLDEAEGARLRTAHRSHYARLAADFDRDFLEPGLHERLRTVRRQHADVRHAVELALADGDTGSATRIVHGLWMYWHITGRCTEARYWCTAIHDHPGSTPADRAAALGVKGYLGCIQGDPEGIEQTQGCLALAREFGGQFLLGRAQLYVQFSSGVLGGLREEAARATAESAKLLVAAGDATGHHVLRMQEAFIHLLFQDPGAARAVCERGLADLGVRAAQDEGWMHASYNYSLAMAHFMSADLAASAECSRAALRVERRIDDVAGASHNLELMAWLAGATGDFREAAWLLGAADSLWQRMGGRLQGNPVLEALHQQTESGSRDALGERRFDGLWREGRALTLVEAVDRATAEDPAPAAHAALTPREREVAELAAQGLSNREISESLVLSKRTVDVHMEHILTKLGIGSRRQIEEALKSFPPAGG